MLRTAADYHFQDVGKIDVERTPLWISAMTGMPMRLFDMLYLSESLNVVYCVMTGIVNVHFNIDVDSFIIKSSSSISNIHSLWNMLERFYFEYESKMYPTSWTSAFLKPNANLPENVTTRTSLSGYTDSEEIKALSIAENYENPDFIRKPWETSIAERNPLKQQYFHDAWNYLDRFKRFLLVDSNLAINVHVVGTSHTEYYNHGEKTSEEDIPIDQNGLRIFNHYGVTSGRGYVRTAENLKVTLSPIPGIKSATIKNIVLRIYGYDKSNYLWHAIAVDASTYEHSFNSSEVRQFLSIVGSETGDVELFFVDVGVKYDFEIE